METRSGKRRREEEAGARDWAGGLPRELLEAVARRVAPEDRFSFRLVCRGWAEAGGGTGGGGGGKQGGRRFHPHALLPDGRRTRTPVLAAAASMARVEWARSCVSDEEWERHIVPRLCEEAAGRGDLEMLKALRAKEFPWDAEACKWAGKWGHLEVLKWLRANGCPLDADAWG